MTTKVASQNASRKNSNDDLLSRKSSRKKVLILEDDEWFAEILVAILASEYEVKTVKDPENVFAKMDEFWPDVILADVVLGAKNLFVLLNEIQSYVDSRNIPIAILSSIAQQIDVRDVVKFNIKVVLDKAEMTPEILLKTLREIIKNSSKNAEKVREKGGVK